MSPRGWLQRVGRMDAGEIVFRARTAARTRAQYLASAWRPRGWRREALAPRLVPSAGAMDSALERLHARDWLGAHEALGEYFHRRVSRFLVSPHALPELAERIRRRFPGAAEEAAAAADRILAGQFDLLGYEGLDFSSEHGDIDWHYDPVHGRRPPLTWWSRVPYLDPEGGDHKVIWEVNRHQHFLALGRAAWLTGRRSYRDAFVAHLESWLRANRPMAGINWASMLELGFRSLSWLWALHLFVKAPSGSAFGREKVEEKREGDDAGARRAGGAPWVVDLLIGLERQLTHVQQNLSLYFSPNTHLTGEALALYVCGRALPELRPASSWEETGRSVLLAEIERQVARDGGHVERSTHYQRYTLDFYLLALAMARATDDPCADRFADAVHRLASATRLYADHEGRVPLIGDDDGGTLFPICKRPPYDLRDSLASAAALLSRPELSVDGTPEETMWLLGNQPSWVLQKKSSSPARHADPLRSALLPDTGYFVSRPRACDHLVFDCGPHGYLNGGHAHADALSLTATLDSRRLFIDPGTATYTMSNEVRDRFRDSRMHNTLTLDGRSQSVPAGPFAWKTVANGRMQRWITSPRLDYFEGVHDGYLPAVHRRRVLAVPGGPVLVVDTVLGDETIHQAEVLWHLDPAWRLDGAERGGISLRHVSGERAWVLALGAQTDFMAGDEGGFGWHSPAYGRIEPSLALRLTARRTSPLTVVSLFGTGHLGNAPSVERLQVESEVPGTDAVALRIRTNGQVDIVVFGYREPMLPERAAGSGAATGPAFPSVEGGRTRVQVGDIETDARLLCVQFDEDGESPRVVMQDDGSARSVSTGRAIGE